MGNYLLNESHLQESKTTKQMTKTEVTVESNNRIYEVLKEILQDSKENDNVDKGVSTAAESSKEKINENKIVKDKINASLEGAEGIRSLIEDTKETHSIQQKEPTTPNVTKKDIM